MNIFSKVNRYKVTIYARGMMGNKYIAGEFEEAVTRKDLKHFDSVAQCVFSKNRKKLKRHFPKSVCSFNASVQEIKTQKWWAIGLNTGEEK